MSNPSTNPAPKNPARPVDTYFIITISEPPAPGEVTVQLCSKGAHYSLEWWNGSVWVPVAPNTVRGRCETATLRPTGPSVPRTSQLKKADLAAVAKA